MMCDKRGCRLKYIIKPALSDEYHVKRADEDARPGPINDQMIVDIGQAQLIIAGLFQLKSQCIL
jgi:hypothetical protein